MFDALTAREVVSVLLLHGLVYYVAFVSCQNDRSFFSNFVNQLFVPSGRSLERVLVSHVIYQEGTRSSLVVILGECVVLFLSSCVPNDKFDALLTNLDLLLQVGGIHCR